MENEIDDLLAELDIHSKQNQQNQVNVSSAHADGTQSLKQSQVMESPQQESFSPNQNDKQESISPGKRQIGLVRNRKKGKTIVPQSTTSYNQQTEEQKPVIQKATTKVFNPKNHNSPMKRKSQIVKPSELPLQPQQSQQQSQQQPQHRNSNVMGDLLKELDLEGLSIIQEKPKEKSIIQEEPKKENLEQQQFNIGENNKNHNISNIDHNNVITTNNDTIQGGQIGQTQDISAYLRELNITKELNHNNTTNINPLNTEQDTLDNNHNLNNNNTIKPFASNGRNSVNQSTNDFLLELDKSKMNNNNTAKNEQSFYKNALGNQASQRYGGPQNDAQDSITRSSANYSMVNNANKILNMTLSQPAQLPSSNDNKQFNSSASNQQQGLNESAAYDQDIDNLIKEMNSDADQKYGQFQSTQDRKRSVLLDSHQFILNK